MMMIVFNSSMPKAHHGMAHEPRGTKYSGQTTMWDTPHQRRKRMPGEPGRSLPFCLEGDHSHEGILHRFGRPSPLHFQKNSNCSATIPTTERGDSHLTEKGNTDLGAHKPFPRQEKERSSGRVPQKSKLPHRVRRTSFLDSSLTEGNIVSAC